MGIVPIWGFQLAAAVALAFVFRLNKALVIIAANISIPPMIPLILFLSHMCGAPWMGNHAVHISFDQGLTVQVFKDSVLQYILGAFTLAALAGAVAGIATFALLKLFTSRR